MIKRIFVFLLLSLSINCVYSQNGTDYDKFVAEAGKFVAEAGDYLNLYRGTSPLPYKTLHIGTYYAFSEEFEKGDLYYNGKIYHDVEMNLNSHFSHLDELYVKVPESGRAVMLNKEFINKFSLGKRNFYLMDKRHEKGAPQPGFYEILYDGQAKLYKKIRKVISEKIGSSVNPVTKSKIERRFDLVETYYLFKAGEWHKISRRNSLLKQYKEKRLEIRRFIRKNSLNSISDADIIYASILKFAESPTNAAHE